MKTDMVHLSEAEWKDFSKGNALSAKDILPMVLHTIGVKLQKKPQDWGVERTEEEKAQLEKEREEKEREEQLKKAQAKKNPKKKEKDVKEDDRPKTAPPEDIALKDLIPEINHFGKLNEIRGFIFVGFPSNE
jgi:adenylate/nucleoside-diphosphate kinase